VKLIVGIAIFLVSGLATGLLIDGYLQAAEIQSPLETYVHPDYGPSYYPDRNFARFNESFFLGRTSAWGTLGEARPERNGNGELRVLLVGDSFVLGHTVFERHHFKRVLEADLEAALGRPVAVLNFARADFNLWNMHRYYRDFASRWDHDHALLFVGEHDLLPSRQVGSDLYPVSVAEGDSVRADYSFRQGASFKRAAQLEPVLSRFATPRLMFNLYKVGLRGELPGVILGKLAPREQAPPPELAGPQELRPLPDNTLGLLRDLAGDPRVTLVFTGPVAPERRQTIAELGVEPLDLEPVFEELRGEGLDPYFWPVTGQRGHWNHRTHIAVGEALAADLLEAGLLR
jgi:hypothetical protein